jgi:hypothetical protein
MVIKMPKNINKWNTVKVERWLQNNVSPKFTAHSINEYVAIYYSDHPNLYFKYKGETWRDAVSKAIAAFDCINCSDVPQIEDVELTQQEENKLKESNVKI